MQTDFTPSRADNCRVWHMELLKDWRLASYVENESVAMGTTFKIAAPMPLFANKSTEVLGRNLFESNLQSVVALSAFFTNNSGESSCMIDKSFIIAFIIEPLCA